MKLKYDKPLIVAEIGLSHNGNFRKAINFIKNAKSSGADVIKFQTHYAQHESTLDEPFRVKISKNFKSRYDYWKKTEFSKKEWKQLINFCNRQKIIFATSPFSIEAVRIMRNLGCKNWKIGSGEALSKKITEEILKNKKDGFIISTGMSTWKEIYKNYNYIRKKKGSNFFILQCTTSYPNNLKNVGLNIIEKMKKKFNCMIGLSDHTGSIFPSIAALSLGAKMIEVHVCLSKKSKGPDTSSSLTFQELKMIANARDEINIMRNNDVDKNILNSKQKKNRKIFSKSLALKNDLKKGEKITKHNITLKKPGIGLNEKMINSILNKIAKKNISSKRIIRVGDFE